MNHDALNEAKKALMIHDIFMRESRVTMHPNFDPKLIQTELAIQIKFGAKSSHIFALKEEGNDGGRLFRVHFETAVRLVMPSHDSHEEIPIESGAAAVEIDATFVAEYAIRNGADLSIEAQAEFAKNNVAFQVWPYWREFLQSTCARISIQPFTLPMFVMPTTESQQATQ